MSEQNTNEPMATLRDGSIKATIWKNESDKGPFYSVSFTRTWVEEGEGAVEDKYHDVNSFSGTDILKVQHLASLAYDQISQYRRAGADLRKKQQAAA